MHPERWPGDTEWCCISTDYLCNEDKFPVTGKALPLWFGATLVPSLTIVLMQLTGTVNPPSAAAATIYITGSKVIKSWGWMALVMPNLVGCVVFVSAISKN